MKKMSRARPSFPSLPPLERPSSSRRLHPHTLLPSLPLPSAADALRPEKHSGPQTLDSRAALVDPHCHSCREIVSSAKRFQGRRAGDQQVVRLMLDEHIRSVTVLVQRLNSDIEVLRQRLQSRNDVTNGTHSAMRTMELQQLSVLGDLRGRVARCDANIARLSADLQSTSENLQSLGKEQNISAAVLETKLREVETQVSVMGRKVDQSTALQEAKKKPAEGDSGVLDSKLKSIADELKAQIVAVQSCMEKEQENALKEVINKIEQLSQLIKHKINSSDKAVQETRGALAGKPDELEETQRTREESQRGRGAEQTLNTRISAIEQRLWEEVQHIRAETNTGFAVVHESLGSMRKVLEAKMKLEREQLERQIRQARRRGSRAEQKERVV